MDSIDTGVPHAVGFVEDAEGLDVQALGAVIRRHEAFAPAGINANFAQVRGDGTIINRTYERGVEDETLACGTGAVAVACIAALKGLAESPVAIQTRGGPILRVRFERKGDRIAEIRLEGEARVVYDGAVTLRTT